MSGGSKKANRLVKMESTTHPTDVKVSKATDRLRGFWNDHFTAPNDERESKEDVRVIFNRDWIMNYEDLCAANVFPRDDKNSFTDVVVPLTPVMSILVVGCGASSLGLDLYDAGFRNVTCTDISHVAIEDMRDKHESSHPGVKWLVSDATNMRDVFDKNDLFDVVIDKAVSDTFSFRCKTSIAETLRERMFIEVARVLKPDGRFVIITPRHSVRNLARPDYRQVGDDPSESLLAKRAAQLKRFEATGLNWSIKKHRVTIKSGEYAKPTSLATRTKLETISVHVATMPGI